MQYAALFPVVVVQGKIASCLLWVITLELTRSVDLLELPDGLVGSPQNLIVLIDIEYIVHGYKNGLLYDLTYFGAKMCQ